MVDRGPNLEEVARFQRWGWDIQRGLTKQALEMGGLILIHVPLPFKLPLTDGFRMGWDNDEAKFLELIHYPMPQSQYVGEPIFTDSIGPIRLPSRASDMMTIVRFGKPMMLQTLEHTNIVKAHPDFDPDIGKFPEGFEVEISHLLGDLLDEGLITLNHLIRSYRILEKDLGISTLDGKERLPPVLTYTIWDISKAENLNLGIRVRRRSDLTLLGEGLFMIHKEFQVDQKTPDRVRTGKIVMLTTQAVTGQPHPFYTATDLVRSAEKRLSQGDYNSAVIEAATGIEAYVHTFARLDLQHREVPPEKIASKLKAGFRNLLEVRLAKRLGLEFDAEKPSNALDRWFTSAYILRNKAVHEGYLVTGKEARQAVSEAIDLLTLIHRRVAASPKKFPEILRLID